MRIPAMVPLVCALALAVPVGAQAPSDTPQLATLVRKALAGHPQLVGARKSASALAEVPSQRGSLPDPMFTFSAQNIRFDDPGLDKSPMTGLLFGLQQRVPFPGKLWHREATAVAHAQVARERVDLVAVQIALRVRRLYYQLHYLERAHAISAQNERVLNTLADVVHARFAVGQGAQQDALQAQVAHSRIRARLKELAQAIESGRRALNAAVGRQPSAELARTEAPALPQQPVVSRSAVALAVAKDNPALSVTRAKVGAAREGVAEARYERWPDLLFGVGYRLRATVPGDPTQGADMFVATVGVTLPLWMGGKQNAAVRQHGEELGAAQAELQDVELDLADQSERTLDAVARLQDELGLFERELLPEADQALDASINDYQNARVGFVSVLSNWRSVLQLQVEREQLRAELATRLAELTALRGQTTGERQP